MVDEGDETDETMNSNAWSDHEVLLSESRNGILLDQAGVFNKGAAARKHVGMCLIIMHNHG